MHERRYMNVDQYRAPRTIQRGRAARPPPHRSAGGSTLGTSRATGPTGSRAARATRAPNASRPHASWRTSAALQQICSNCVFAFVKCNHLARDVRTPWALSEVLRALCDALRAEVRQRDAPADGERRRTLPLAALLRRRVRARGCCCCVRARVRARRARAGAVVREDRREELVCVDQPARAPKT